MAIAFVNFISNNGGNTASPVILTLNTTKGNDLYVGVVSNNPVIRITDSAGSAYQRLNRLLIGPGQTSKSVELWRALAAATNASNNISVAFGAGNLFAVVVIQYSGVKAIGNMATLQNNDLNSNPASQGGINTFGPNIKTQDANNWLLGVLGYATSDPAITISSAVFSAGGGNLNVETASSTAGSGGNTVVDVADAIVATPRTLRADDTNPVTGPPPTYYGAAIAIELRSVAPPPGKQTQQTSTRNDPTNQNGVRV